MEFDVSTIGNVSLVGMGVKPASELFSTISEDSFQAMPMALGRSMATERYLQSQGVRYFRSYIGGDDETNAKVRANNFSGPATYHVHTLFASNASNLAQLIDAFKANDDGAIGKALGFPSVAIDAYCDPIRPVRSSDIWVQLIDAKQYGHQIPAWFGYISHTPSKMNLTGNDVCRPSKDLGEFYRAAIAQRLPEVIPRLDAEANAKVPSSYRITENGEKEFSWPMRR